MFNRKNIINIALAIVPLTLIFLSIAVVILLGIHTPKYVGNFLIVINQKILFILKNFSLEILLLAVKQGVYADLFISLSLSALITVIFTVSLLNARKKIALKKNLHGNAKWSNKSDLKKSGLLEETGIIVGKHEGQLLKFGGQEFCSCGAPTRSGKGVSVVIPNLLEWENSCVVLDIKQECFTITSKYREEKLKQKVFLFNPFSYNTHRYNPLKYLDFSSPDIEIQIQALANSLYPSGGGNKEFFTKQAQSLFVAIVFLLGKLNEEYLLWENRFTLTALAGALHGIKLDLGGNEPSIVPLDETVETARKMGLLTDTIYSKFKSFFDQSEAKDQFIGVKGSYENPLKIFEDSLFEKATSENDFDFRDLRKEKITIYIGIEPDNIKVAGPILNLLFTQLIYENIRQGLPDIHPELKHNVLILMDEFISIGYMEQYQTAVSYMAGYNLRSLIIYQNRTQLGENPPLGYGDKGSDTLLENHACQIIFRPKNTQTADEISKRIGNITTESSNKSYTSKDVMNTSRSENQTSRALVLPQEILSLKDDEELIFCNAVKIKCKKAFFYNDEYFINKLKSISPSLKKVKGIPTQSQLKNSYVLGETSIELPNLNDTDEQPLF